MVTELKVLKWKKHNFVPQKDFLFSSNVGFRKNNFFQKNHSIPLKKWLLSYEHQVDTYFDIFYSQTVKNKEEELGKLNQKLVSTNSSWN